MNNQAAQTPTPAERGLPDEPHLPELPQILRYDTSHMNSYGIRLSDDGELVDYDDHITAMHAYGRACYEAALSARPLPSDWVAVPRVLTTQMHNAIVDEMARQDNKWRYNPEAMLAAILEAAPSAPAEGVQTAPEPLAQGLTDEAIERALDTKVGLDHTLRKLIRGDTMPVGYSKVHVMRELLRALRIPTPNPPQPSASVGQRARELFNAMLSAPYGDTTIGDIVCAETTRNRLESAWLPIIESALTTAAGGGGEVGNG